MKSKRRYHSRSSKEPARAARRHPNQRQWSWWRMPTQVQERALQAAKNMRIAPPNARTANSSTGGPARNSVTKFLPIQPKTSALRTKTSTPGASRYTTSTPLIALIVIMVIKRNYFSIVLAPKRWTGSRLKQSSRATTWIQKAMIRWVWFRRSLNLMSRPLSWPWTARALPPSRLGRLRCHIIGAWWTIRIAWESRWKI